MLFPKAENIGLLAGGSFKKFFPEVSYDQTLIEVVFNALPHFPKKWFQIRHSKISQQQKNGLFKLS